MLLRLLRAWLVDQLDTTQLVAQFGYSSHIEVIEDLNQAMLGVMPSDYREVANYLAAYRHISRDLRDILFRILFELQTTSQVAVALATSSAVIHRLYSIAQAEIARRI